MKLIVGLIALMSSSIALSDSIDFSKTIEASELAEHFFGPQKEAPVKRTAINIGRLGVSAKTKLNCGRLDVVASVEAEVRNVESQLKQAGEQIKSMFNNPASLAMATVCYYKPSVCSYIRHSSLMFGDNMNLAFNACKSIDQYIDTQADKGMRTLQAEGVKQCILDRSGGGKISSEDIRVCQAKKGRMRDLLKPFSTKYANGKQKVLASLVETVGESKQYGPMAQILGEVEVYQNGYWVKAFPKDLVTPDQFVSNALAAGSGQSCDLTTLRKVVSGEQPPGQGPLDVAVSEVIREKINGTVIRDLESIPARDRTLVCRAIGDAVAEIAIKRLGTKYQSIMAAALSNDALPDDLRAFYENRSEDTLKAISDRAKAQEITPLLETVGQLGRLAYLFRQKNRDEASGVSSKRIDNQNVGPDRDCEDVYSCGG